MSSRRSNRYEGRSRIIGMSKKARARRNGTCPRSGKVRFVTERDAVKAAARIKSENPHKRDKSIPTFRYNCPSCGDWHLTNQPPGVVAKVGDAET